jgi:hypothetical protein
MRPPVLFDFPSKMLVQQMRQLQAQRDRGFLLPDALGDLIAQRIDFPNAEIDAH